jgi:hypothetical protein
MYNSSAIYAVARDDDSVVIVIGCGFPRAWRLSRGMMRRPWLRSNSL